MLAQMAAVAELEAGLISQRTKAALAATKGAWHCPGWLARWAEGRCGPRHRSATAASRCIRGPWTGDVRAAVCPSDHWHQWRRVRDHPRLIDGQRAVPVDDRFRKLAALQGQLKNVFESIEGFVGQCARNTNRGLRCARPDAPLDWHAAWPCPSNSRQWQSGQRAAATGSSQSVGTRKPSAWL
jgi:hypothetical protein